MDGGHTLEFDVFTTFIDPRSYVLIPVLYFIVLLLRETPHVHSWTHAWIATALSVISCFLYYGFMIQSFVEGVLVAGAAILTKDLIHKTVSQTKSKDDDDKH